MYLIVRYQNIITKKTVYDSLDKARAAARRKVNYGTGFYAVGIYEITEKSQKFLGEVVYDGDYNSGGFSGIFWIPKGKRHEGYRAKGVSANGKLNSHLYKLT